MQHRYFSLGILQETAALYHQFDGNVAEMANVAGVTRDTMRRRVTELEVNHPEYLNGPLNLLTQTDESVKETTLQEFFEEVLDCAPVEEVKPSRFDLEMRRKDMQITALRDRLKETEEHVLRAEDERDAYKALKSAEVPTVKWQKGPYITKRNELIPMLFTSDMHVGEVIKPEELDNMNKYDMHIFKERYNLLIEKTIDLSENHTGNPDFAGVFYLRGGDALSGEIHAELADTNDLSSVEACRVLVAQEREGIKRLRAKFGRVRVVSVPGNHGRNTLKPRSKNSAGHSYESLIAWWLESLFENDPNVTFVTPASSDAYFNVMGHNVLLNHGDKMGSGGGQGFVGVSLPIARGHQKLKAQYAAAGLPVNVILSGHYHSSMMLPTGFANGSMVGYSQYSNSFRATPDAPKQWLIMMSEKYGASQYFEVILGEKPQRIALDF